MTEEYTIQKARISLIGFNLKFFQPSHPPPGTQLKVRVSFAARRVILSPKSVPCLMKNVVLDEGAWGLYPIKENLFGLARYYVL